MTSRRISGFDSTPSYVGEEGTVFTLKLHIGGDLVWHPKIGYRDGGVEYFDHFNCHEGSLLDLRRMVKQLRFCDRKAQFWVLVKGRKNKRKTELRPIISDADIVSLVGVVKDGFTGHVLKQKLWAVCKATTEPEYKRQMEELKALNAKAAEWLDARDAKHYCKAYFTTFPKTDLLLNNLCESWNGIILNFRDKPVLSMCEKLRIYLMTRMQKKTEKALRVILRRFVLRYASCLKRKRIGHVAEMEDREAGMERVVAEEVQVEGQFEDIAVETQVPSFVLDEMELRNSQPSQAIQNQAPSLSEFISAQLPSESSTPNVITRSGKNYVTVATLQHSKAVQRETRKKRTTAKKK
nr:uncharacterized protein LOC109190596 [Ipomoea batatas]